MTLEEAHRLLISTLGEIYDEREAASITALVMERLTGMPKGLRLVHKTDLFNSAQTALLHQWLGEMQAFRPVQYVLGEAWFGPYAFYVDERVLIPRPETEELADFLIRDSADRPAGTSVLDIGTGSGCIPVYLKKKRRDFVVRALDTSQPALEIAQRNSEVNDAQVEFFKCDILRAEDRQLIPASDLFISNPPYIPELQKKEMDRHVKDFEPGIALFVPDNDPLLFYRIIAEIAEEKLNPGGALWLELHHDHAEAVQQWYRDRGFSIESKKDSSGKNRMLKAWKT